MQTNRNVCSVSVTESLFRNYRENEVIRLIMVYNCRARFDKGHTGLNSLQTECVRSCVLKPHNARVETDRHCTIVYSNVTDNFFLGIKTKNINACTSFWTKDCQSLNRSPHRGYWHEGLLLGERKFHFFLNKNFQSHQSLRQLAAGFQHPFNCTGSPQDTATIWCLTYHKRDTSSNAAGARLPLGERDTISSLTNNSKTPVPATI